MSFIQRFEVAVTTIADGSATAYTPNFTGKLSQIRYVKTDYAAGVDFTITSEATGETIWTQADVNASATVVHQDKRLTALLAWLLYMLVVDLRY